MNATPILHVPFKRLALCLDCEKCYELGPESCPACGSRTFVTLARFLEGLREPISDSARGPVSRTWRMPTIVCGAQR